MEGESLASLSQINWPLLPLAFPVPSPAHVNVRGFAHVVKVVLFLTVRALVYFGRRRTQDDLVCCCLRLEHASSSFAHLVRFRAPLPRVPWPWDTGTEHGKGRCLWG